MIRNVMRRLIIRSSITLAWMIIPTPLFYGLSWGLKRLKKEKP